MFQLQVLEYANIFLHHGKLTSDTLRPSWLLSFVKLAELLKILDMPMSGKRLCREYDSSILNLGKLISSLLKKKKITSQV